MLNKKVIIRADRAGVFLGTLKEKNGSEVTLTNCRRLWYWDGAASLMQLAMEGVTAPQNCKFTVPADEVIILDVCEILPCTDKAVECIDKISVWKR